MNNKILEIILISIVLITITIYLLKTLLKNSNNKFAHFINKIWNEWFEDQWYAIIAFILIMLLACLLGLIFR